MILCFFSTFARPSPALCSLCARCLVFSLASCFALRTLFGVAVRQRARKVPQFGVGYPATAPDELPIVMATIRLRPLSSDLCLISSTNAAATAARVTWSSCLGVKGMDVAADQLRGQRLPCMLTTTDLSSCSTPCRCETLALQSPSMAYLVESSQATRPCALTHKQIAGARSSPRFDFDDSFRAIQIFYRGCASNHALWRAHGWCAEGNFPRRAPRGSDTSKRCAFAEKELRKDSH